MAVVVKVRMARDAVIEAAGRRQRRKIEGGVREMARLIGDRQWAVGEAFGLGDISIGISRISLDPAA